MANLMAREVRDGLVRLRWTPEALGELLRRGDLEADRHYEILNGQLFEKAAQSWSHAFAVSALQLTFGRLDAQTFYVSGQLPLRGDQDLPEPDLKVIRGGLLGRRDTPTAAEALLVVEVSDSTFATDFRIKAPIYASAGIPVYWIVDVNRRRVEVRSHPADAGYGQVNVYEDGDVLPAAFDAGPSVSVSDLFVAE